MYLLWYLYTTSLYVRFLIFFLLSRSETTTQSKRTTISFSRKTFNTVHLKNINFSCRLSIIRTIRKESLAGSGFCIVAYPSLSITAPHFRKPRLTNLTKPSDLKYFCNITRRYTTPYAKNWLPHISICL